GWLWCCRPTSRRARSGRGGKGCLRCCRDRTWRARRSAACSPWRCCPGGASCAPASPLPPPCAPPSPPPPSGRGRRPAASPLAGVLHTAGLFTGGLIQLKTPESLAASLRPVVAGAEALLAALTETGEPACVVLTGSTLTFAGGLGQFDIAAAGAYVDALAQSR